MPFHSSNSHILIGFKVTESLLFLILVVSKMGAVADKIQPT